MNFGQRELPQEICQVDQVLIDCDQDALVYQVTLIGEGVCHTYDEEGKHRKRFLQKT